MAPLTTADQISDIAFAFMGSKALFAALEQGVFTHLSEGAMTASELAAKTDLDTDRAETLLTALAGMGLVTVEAGRFGNAPASEAFLVKGAKYDFGDYLRLQVGKQMYPLLDQIEDALTGNLPDDAIGSYAEWFADADKARLYSESQHAGSLGPARQLAKALDLDGVKTMLDVGGGTGAFAITLAKAAPEMKATIVEFPNVAALGREYVDEAGLSDRISYHEGNALEAEWPKDQDLILMSYLLSGIPGQTHADLMKRAYDHLAPGGKILVHDFVVNADRTGPKLAALWQLQHTAFTPEARSLDSATLEEDLKAAGFEGVETRTMIPEMTMLTEGKKP